MDDAVRARAAASVLDLQPDARAEPAAYANEVLGRMALRDARGDLFAR